MPAERYFNSREFEQGASLYVEDQEYHHLMHVMRTEVGEQVEVINGMGQLAVAHLSSIEKKRAILSIKEVQTVPQETPLILAQAIPRINRLEYILEKGTELGMTEIWLFPTVHSERKSFSENQMKRFETIVISALKQCGRLWLPKILLKPNINEWKDLPQNSYFGDTSPNAPWLADILKQPSNEEILFCIGPESGFTDDETHQLKQLGCTGVKLHKNILRTDTAAIASLVLTSHRRKG